MASSATDAAETLGRCDFEEWQGRYSLNFPGCTQQRSVSRRASESLASTPRFGKLADSTRTAQEAAEAVGVEVGQIVKSLVFVDQESPLLCLCAATGAWTRKSSRRSATGQGERGARGDGLRDRRGAATRPRAARANCRRCLPTSFETSGAGGTPRCLPCHRGADRSDPGRRTSARSPDESHCRVFPAPWLLCRGGAPPRLSTC